MFVYTVTAMRPHKGITHNVIHTSIVSTPLGEMFAAATQKGLSLLSFGDKFHIDAKLEHLKQTFNAQVIPAHSALFEQLQQELDEYFEGKRNCFDIPLQLVGTHFQVEAWKALLKIPYGETLSYKQQAYAMNHPTAHRAVANANAQNMIAIIVPCHRVIRDNGEMGGYSGGVEKKEFLLNLEHC